MFERNQGRGIGLTLCKKLCDLFNWDIQFKTKIHIGTTVKFTFAAKREELSQRAINSQQTYFDYLVNHSSSALAESDTCRIAEEDQNILLEEQNEEFKQS